MPNGRFINLQDKLKLSPGDILAADGIIDDTLSIFELRDYLQSESDYRGGVLELPKGIFKMTETLSFSQYQQGQVHNIILRGQGPNATVIDFSGLNSSQDGITFGAGVHFGIEHLSIRGAGRDGISIVGGPKGSLEYAAQGFINNVRIQQSGRHGVFSQNAFLLSINNTWSFLNNASGFVFNGFHTTLTGARNWALENVNGAGWSFNGITYGSFQALGSDNNRWGYSFSNINGLTLLGCGAEGSLLDSYIVQTSDSISQNTAYSYTDVKGLVLVGCHALNGSSQTAGQFGSFLSIKTSDNRPVGVSLIGCTNTIKDINDKSILISSASGPVTITEQGCKFQGSIIKSGADKIFWEGRAFKFTPLLSGSIYTGYTNYSVRRGHYTVANGICTFDIELQWLYSDNSGNIEIQGLPYNCNSTNTIVNLNISGIAYTGVVGAHIAPGANKITITDTISGQQRSGLLSSVSGSLLLSGSYAI